MGWKNYSGVGLTLLVLLLCAWRWLPLGEEVAVAVASHPGPGQDEALLEQRGVEEPLAPTQGDAAPPLVRKEARVPGSELRLVGMDGSPVKGVLLEQLDDRLPRQWNGAQLSDHDGRIALEWSGAEFAWIRLTALGYATKRTLLEQFEGQRTLVIEPEGRIFGRLIASDAGFTYEGAEILYWPTPLISPELAALRMVERSREESLVASVRADRNGLFEITGLSPSATYSLFSRHPLAVSRSAINHVSPGSTEHRFEIGTVWAVSIQLSASYGSGLGIPTELSKKHSGGKPFSISRDYRGMLRVSEGLEAWLSESNHAEEGLLLACFLWSGEGEPGPMVAKVRLPGCEERKLPVQPRLLPEALENSEVLDMSSCGTYGHLEFSLAGVPLVESARRSDIGMLHLKSVSGAPDLYYPLTAVHSSYRWGLIVPSGEYELDLHDAMGFGRGEHGAAQRSSVSIAEGKATEASLEYSGQGSLALELLRANGGAWEEEFWCELEWKTASGWRSGGRVHLIPGESAKHRLVVPLLPPGRHALLVAGGFAAMEPAVPSPPEGQMLRVEFDITAGGSTRVILNALF